MTQKQIDLLHGYLDGTLGEADFARLQSLLRENAEARRMLRSLSTVNTKLSQLAAVRLETVKLLTDTVVESKPSSRWPARHALAVMAAALVIFGAVAALIMSDSWSSSVHPFAVLVAANEAVWADPNVELALRGGELPPEALRLKSGTAEFLCEDGAAVVMRGPAVIRFSDRKRVFVESGRIFFRCPSPESRLAVETATTEVMDLGTEFAVDARADRSTMVAVLSGEVRVGRTQPRLLRQGEAVEVRNDGVLIIKPLAWSEVSELLRAAPLVTDADLHSENLLRDPDFENGLSEETWSGTEGHIESVPSGGRSGAAVRVFAGGYAPWPQCLQKVARDDLPGKLAVASVWAATPAKDRLRDGQFASLKFAFLDDQGRQFAYSVRNVLKRSPAPERFEKVQLATIVPPGTRAVLLQLVLAGRGFDSGSVLFDDAALMIADPPPTN